jgi:NAD(P)-dependent dehydrogenase (short-subunit alcohol dehydrogenase family)
LGDPPVVLVTGASSGIGKACARRLAASGSRVFGCARSAPAEGEPFPLIHMDVRDERSVNDCVSRVVREAGRIDVLVNCAGIVVGGSAEEMLIEEIRDQIETNLLGLIRSCRAVLPGMRTRKTGLIVNMGSLAGLMGVPFQSAYSATKHGIEGYSESLQMEVRAFGVRVVLIDPGDVLTEITLHRKESQGTGKDSPYRRNLSAAMHAQAESELRGWKVERIARLVERVARSRRPRFRYTPGPFVERIAPVARRIIPDRLFLSILAGFYGVK